MEEQIVNQMAHQNRVDKQMKAEHQMNSFTQSAQEIVMNDLIYQ